MPVGLDFEDLQQRCLAWLDDESNDGTLLTNVKNALNDANAQRATEFDWPFMKANIPTTTSIGSSQTIGLPIDVRKLVYVYNVTQDKLIKIVPERHIRGDDFLYSDASQNRTVDNRATLRGPINSSTSALTLEFFAPPTSGDILRIDYYRYPTIMSAATDYPDLPFPHSQLLVWDALLNLKAYALEPDAISVWQDNQQRALASLYHSFGTVADVVGGESESFLYSDF